MISSLLFWVSLGLHDYLLHYGRCYCCCCPFQALVFRWFWIGRAEIERERDSEYVFCGDAYREQLVHASWLNELLPNERNMRRQHRRKRTVYCGFFLFNFSLSLPSNPNEQQHSIHLFTLFVGIFVFFVFYFMLCPMFAIFSNCSWICLVVFYFVSVIACICRCFQFSVMNSNCGHFDRHHWFVSILTLYLVCVIFT